jgi:hypothetical protein
MMRWEEAEVDTLLSALFIRCINLNKKKLTKSAVCINNAVRTIPTNRCVCRCHHFRTHHVSAGVCADVQANAER